MNYQFAATLLTLIFVRSRGSTQRWVDVDRLIRATSIDPDLIDPLIDFLSRRKLIITIGNPVYAVKLTLKGWKLAAAGRSNAG